MTVKDRIALLELETPGKFNLISTEVAVELNEIALSLEKDDSVTVVILTSRKADFAAGINANIFPSMTQKALLLQDIFERQWNVVFPRFRKPVIGAISGLCLGGAFEMVASCDILLASEDAKFGQPEINLGMFPGSGGSSRLASTIGKQNAAIMAMTGQPISGSEAYRLRLVSQLHADKE